MKGIYFLFAFYIMKIDQWRFVYNELESFHIYLDIQLYNVYVH